MTRIIFVLPFGDQITCDIHLELTALTWLVLKGLWVVPAFRRTWFSITAIEDGDILGPLLLAAVVFGCIRLILGVIRYNRIRREGRLPRRML